RLAPRTVERAARRKRLRRRALARQVQEPGRRQTPGHAEVLVGDAVLHPAPDVAVARDVQTEDPLLSLGGVVPRPFPQALETGGRRGRSGGLSRPLTLTLSSHS